MHSDDLSIEVMKETVAVKRLFSCMQFTSLVDISSFPPPTS